MHGHTDDDFNETGVKQAEVLAQRLQNEAFVKAYSSDLKRAFRTTIEIFKKKQDFNCQDDI